MSDMVSVPAEKIAALRAEANQFGPPTGLVPTPVTVGLLAAARAVVDAVETEDEPHGNIQTHADPYANVRPDPSPARDEAEKAKLTDAEKAEITAHIEAGRTWQTLAYVECILAAHMAAPDERDALRERVAELEKYTEELKDAALAEDAKYMKLAHRRDELADKAMGYRAERDALRERIRALADRWEARAPDMHDDARDILLNHAAAIRTAIEPEFVPLPEPHVCDDYCQTCREPGDA